MKYMYYYQFHVSSGWTDKGYVQYPSEIYSVMQDVFGSDWFSDYMLNWCKNANSGDIFEDEDVRVVKL